MEEHAVRKVLSVVTALLCVSSLAVAADFSPEQLHQRSIERRAVEATIWGMPAVNTDLMLQEMLAKTPAKVGQVVYWGRPLDWHNQTLTPNPDALYFMAFFDTRNGPVVLDLPPGDAEGSFNANIVNVWQMPLEDAGLLGADKGAGGKYVVLPPGRTDKMPDGFIRLQSDTFGGYMLFRANLPSHSNSDVEKAISYGKRMKVYPLSQADKPPETTFIDAKDVVFDSTIKYDATFFKHLDRIVQTEPWLQRDRAMIDQLKTLGIEKGKSFSPDKATEELLDAGANEAHAILSEMYESGWPSFFEGTQWRPAGPADVIKMQSTNYADVDAYPGDLRGMVYTYGYVGLKRLGAGQFYLISLRDKDGMPFDGDATYRVTVPKDVPIAQYWSVTAYDRETHALIRGMSRASRSSQLPELTKNSDGSVDVYFGPTAPAGKESNWVPTDPKRGFELMFRLYGPKKEFFEKAWVLPDPVKLP
jgi:hypothetical protein